MNIFQNTVQEKRKEIQKKKCQENEKSRMLPILLALQKQSDLRQENNSNLIKSPGGSCKSFGGFIQK